MSDPYERVKGGRLAFKGGILASRSKSIDKAKNKKKKRTTAAPVEDEDTGPNHNPTPDPNPNPNPNTEEPVDTDKQAEASEYTIDAAKRMKYDQLFPVEAKKFGYQPKTNFNSVEDALDDRVKKKADRYCK